MVKETVTLENSAGMQGFVFNLRRPRFDNIHVREALLIGLMILNGPKRTCFTANMPYRFVFSGLGIIGTRHTASKDELALLTPLRDKLPAKTFDDPLFENPVTDAERQYSAKFTQGARAV